MSATTIVSATAVVACNVYVACNFYVFGPVRIRANADVTVNPLSVSREERFKQMGFDKLVKKNLVKDLVKNSPKKRPRREQAPLATSLTRSTS